MVKLWLEISPEGSRPHVHLHLGLPTSHGHFMAGAEAEAFMIRHMARISPYLCDLLLVKSMNQTAVMAASALAKSGKSSVRDGFSASRLVSGIVGPPKNQEPSSIPRPRPLRIAEARNLLFVGQPPIPKRPSLSRNFTCNMQIGSF